MQEAEPFGSASTYLFTNVLADKSSLREYYDRMG